MDILNTVSLESNSQIPMTAMAGSRQGPTAKGRQNTDWSMMPWEGSPHIQTGRGTVHAIPTIRVERQPQ